MTDNSSQINSKEGRDDGGSAQHFSISSEMIRGIEDDILGLLSSIATSLAASIASTSSNGSFLVKICKMTRA